MEYRDNIIASPEEFAKMAKEYSQKLKKSKNSEIKHSDLFLKLFLLNYLYSYIKRNVRSPKLKVYMENLEHQTTLDISDLCTIFETDCKDFKISKPKHLNNLSSCIKLALKTEAELLYIILINNLVNNSHVLEQISLNHLENIKNLSQYL